MNWKKVKLKDITEIITKGTTPTTIGYSYTNEGVNFIKIESITDNGAFLFDKMTHISLECHQKMSRSQLKENDIIFSIAGAIGKTAIVSKEILPANTNQALAIIRLNTDEIDVEFLFRSLRSEYILKQFNKKKQGVAQLNLSLKDISELEIVYPSLTRQKEIVKILNKAQSLIGKRKEQLKFLDELVKSQFIEMFGDPIINSKGLQIKNFEKVVRLQRGFDLPTYERDINGNINVWGSNGVLSKHSTAKVDEPGVITGRSGSIGNVYYTLEPYWPLNTTLFSKDTFGNNVIYLSYLLKFYKLERFSNGTGVPTLNRNLLDGQKIIDVPLEEQNCFADFVKQVDKLKFEMENSLKELEDNFNSLMKKAFNGELLK